MAIELNICVHATGPYISYAHRLMLDIDHWWQKSLSLKVTVFTDVPVEVSGWSFPFGLEVTPIEVPHRSWPDSTILRFADYAHNGDNLDGSNLMFLDADMSVVGPLDELQRQDKWVAGIALVLHPGFYRRENHGVELSDTREKSGDEYLGSWETNRESLAYVPEILRNYYICGGSWMGRRQEALALCAELAARIKMDNVNGVTAVWHDESHLNWWRATYGPTMLSPEYCYVVGYDQLEGITPRIIALDKPPEFVLQIKG
jgi:hypothetical protein